MKKVRITFILVLSVSYIKPASGDFTEFPICTDSFNQSMPAVSGNVVVWEDVRNGNTDIYGCDVSIGSVFPICTDTACQSRPDISGSIVVWESVGGLPDSQHYEIGGKNLSSGEDLMIYYDPTESRYPAISGNIVVWANRTQENNPNDPYKIYGKNLFTDEVFVVCEAPAAKKYNPDISGNYVVWEDLRNNHHDIYGRDLTTGDVFPICISIDYKLNPHISGNFVVWEVDSKHEIRGYDLSTSTEFFISNGYNPNISGDIVVWEKGPLGNLDIYGYDLSSGTEFVICDPPGDQKYPSISGDLVVWQASYTGESTDIHGAYIPEPATLILLALGSLVMNQRCRKVRG